MNNEPTDTEQEPTTHFKAYNYLWEFFYNEHGLVLLHSEMDDILKACERFKEIYNGKD